MDVKEKKRVAAERALEYIQPGMLVGLGTGSTAAEFVDLLGARVAAGLDITCVATSDATQRQATSLGIKMTTLDDCPFLDLTVDGADEIDHELRLLKGGGGALLREKIVATASDRMIVIADDSKQVERLGRFPLPIEIVNFGLAATKAMVEAMAHDADLDGEIVIRSRPDGSPFLTDCGNVILDCSFGEIPDPALLADLLSIVPGVVEHGLFLGLADIVIIAGSKGVTVQTAMHDDETDEA
ncbi:MAG: ribose-5-phosphate isomerase RpiA [Hyphomicrobiaceae bacterium]